MHTPNPHLNQAREWTRLAVAHETSEASRAAAKVIESLPDEWVDANKVRELADQLAEEAGDFASENLADRYMGIAKRLRDVLTPPLPTLADMNEGDRHALIGKDVKVEGWNNPSMLIAVHKDEGAVLAHSWSDPWPFVEVRPLSELSPVNEGNAEG